MRNIILGVLAGTSLLLAGQVRADEMDLAKKHLCTACHAVDKKLVGPAFKDVAAKYKGDGAAAAKLFDKVRKGGSGAWGAIPMPPNPNPKDDEIKSLVAWILKQ